MVVRVRVSARSFFPLWNISFQISKSKCKNNIFCSNLAFVVFLPRLIVLAAENAARFDDSKLPTGFCGLKSNNFC